jgi:thiamine-phosphate pyrophosphorylase
VDPAFPRLHVVTDTRPAAGSTPLTVVRAAIAGAASVGATHELAVQVRVEDVVTDREAYALTVAVLDICRPARVLCLVNDRLHIAVAAGADGGHVGADDLPVAAARRVLDAGVLGATCRDAEAATAAVAAGATYLGAGPAFTTSTKSGLPDPIGPDGIGAVARAVPGTPVLAIGGVTRRSAGMLRAVGAWGIAVVGALSAARDPQRAAIELLAAVTASSPPGAAVDGPMGGPRSPGAARVAMTGTGAGA